MNVISKVRRKSSRVKFRLRELNLKLIRLFIFNRIFTRFSFFYGKFLNHVLYILTNLKQFKFKFCLITNNSVNAKFLTRYMGLKLKRKFPIFVVVNPLKKEFRKLAAKKKNKNFNPFLKSLSFKNRLSYKDSYMSILKYLYDKYLKYLFTYYEDYKMLITFDVYFYFFMLKNKYKTLLTFYKKKILQYLKFSVWIKYKKKRFINKK
jgi:hypothetical protein